MDQDAVNDHPEKIEKPLPFIELTADIVAAFVSNNNIAISDLPLLIQGVGKQLSILGQDQIEPKDEKPEPAVPILRSITPEYIVCLEDGKKLKMLKRHLKTRYDMTPEDYRQRWGLKDDYPMVAPAYTQKRSDLAKKIGLGRRSDEPAAKMVTQARPATKKVPAKRAPRKAKS